MTPRRPPSEMTDGEIGREMTAIRAYMAKCVEIGIAVNARDELRIAELRASRAARPAHFASHGMRDSI